jgi:hypothetical protein
MTLPLPIVERELRGAARRRATFGLRTGLAFAFTLVWAIMMATRPRHYSAPQWNYQVFVFLGIVGMLFCLFSGIFLTSDCLSCEKREGTLGLLFLTDLNGRDVVLGKLAAFSVNATFGLLAVLPLLSLTLMSGGITTAEIYRVVLICFVLLFYSLGIGLGVSALVWGARRAVLTALGIVCAQTILVPIAWIILALMVRSAQDMAWMLIPCPVIPFVFAFDDPYRSNWGAVYYWLSTGLLFLTGLGGVLTACRVLPAKRFQEPPLIKPGSDGSFWHDYLHGGQPWRDKVRQRFLDANPFRWLALRDGLAGFWLRTGLVIGLVFWFLLFLAGKYGREREVWVLLRLAVTWLLHIFVKVILAVEASRVMSDSQACGALELLLVTPLRPAAMVRGIRQSLGRVFAPSLTWLLVLNGWLLLFSPPFPGGVREHQFIQVASLGGLVLLGLDCWALSWLGLAAAIRSKSHLRAMVSTLGWVMAPPWLYLILLFMVGAANHVSSLLPMWAAWFIPTVLSGLWFGFRARARVRRDFLAGAP